MNADVGTGDHWPHGRGWAVGDWQRCQEEDLAKCGYLFLQAHLGGAGVPCSSSAPTAEGSCANAVPRSGEPCTNWAEGPRQPWPESTMVVVEETPASPDACPVEDVSMCSSHRCDGDTDAGSPAR